MTIDNNIPQGYKQTELGLLPADWDIQSVGRHCSVKARIGWQGLRSDEYLTSGEYGLITSTDIVDGMVDWRTCCFVSKARYSQDPNIIVQENDTLISKDGTIGKVGIVQNIPFPSTLNSGVFVVRPKLDNVYKKYLAFAFKSIYFQDFINRLTAGSTIVHLYQKDIVKFVFPVPPIAEQRAIAEALSDVDGLIAALDKKIAKKRLFKQGAMQQLLTGKKRLPGFTNKWVEKPIRLLCKLYGRIGFRGYTKADLVHKGEGAITFSPSDIHEQVISYTNCDYISWRKYDESPEIQVFNGDIIFCKTASIGKCAIIKNLSEKATINPQFVVLKDFKCNNEWLYYSIIDRKFQTVVSGITGGSTIPTMSQEKLYEQTLLCPPTIEEQQAIATILSDMDKEIADLEVQRDKYRLLKSGMMQKLLTGQIRLKTE